MISSVERWAAAPTPEEPNESLPGFFLAYSISSPTFFTGKSLLTRIMIGAMPTSDTGVKLATGSNFSLPS